MGLLEWLFSTPSKSSATAQMRSAVAAPARHVRNGRAVVEIRRNSQPYYDERGWRLEGDTLFGFYRIPRQSAIAGFIANPFSKDPTFYIVDPPRALLRASHGACFRQRSKSTFVVHFSKRPVDVNAGIRALEQCIREVF